MEILLVLQATLPPSPPPPPYLLPGDAAVIQHQSPQARQLMEQSTL